MATISHFLLLALLVAFVTAQVSSVVNGTTTSVIVSSTTGSVASVTTSSLSPPSTTPSAPPSTTPSATTSPSVAPTTSAQPTSSAPPPSSSSVPPPATSSSTTRASSAAPTSASSSPSARSTTPTAVSPPPSTSNTAVISSTRPTAAPSSVISSTETSTVAAPSTTSVVTASAPSTASSSAPLPPLSSTATSRSLAQSTSTASSSPAEPQRTSSSSSSSARSRTESSSSRTAESSVYVFSSVSSSVIQSTVISTNAVIVTTQGENGQLTQSTSYTVVATTIPATTVYATTVVTSAESPTGIAGLQAQAIGGSDASGLSTGAKAGIGAGVGVLVVAAAIFGALFAMRRRRRNKDRIAESDRYPPSSTPSFFGAGGAAFGKRNSRYTDSELPGSNSPPMRETNPLDRYATPGVSSQRTTLPANSRTSDISSMSGSEPTTYRPGPGMPVVAEYNRNHGIEELPEQNRYNKPDNDYVAPVGYSEASGNPFHEKSGNDTPSLYSDDGDGVPQRYPSHRQASPAALELSGENTLVSSMSTSSGGYRGMDPEQPYHTRSQLTKPSAQQRQFDPSHNF